MSKTLNLKIVGDHTMHCAGCEHSVTFALSQMPGVEYAKADWNTQEIHIDFSDTAPKIEEIKTELDWIGYKVEEV